jgi:hypothetical protein
MTVTAEQGRKSGRGKMAAVLGAAALLMALAGAVVYSLESPAGPLSPSSAVEPSAAAPQHVVQVYYFHRSIRCPSCEKIETLAQRAVEEGFAGELAAGTVQWRAVNIDEAPDQHFEKDYQLRTQSVIVSEVRGGKETRWKNLEQVWDLLNDDSDFVRYVQDEVRAFGQET